MSSPQRQPASNSLRSFAPSAALRSRVNQIDIIENAPGAETLVLPSTSAVLGFQFRGRVLTGTQALSLAGVTGLLSSARRYSYLGDTGSVLVRFTPQGASCLGVPAAEIANRSAALEELLSPARVMEVSERLHAAADDRARLSIVEQLLLELPFARDPAVTQALSRLGNPDEEASVASVARELGISERQLERRFLARVGLSPKSYAKLCRFERAVLLVPTARSLSAVAQSAGYFDQSHFIRDFRAFVGVAPREHLDSQ